MKIFSTYVVLSLLIALTSTLSAQINWTKHPSNPVLDPGPDGAWDEGLVVAPYVLFDGQTYKMWYWGYDLRSIGYASSPDGRTWTKYDDPATTSSAYSESDPVLIPGQPGSWEDASVATPSVLLIDNIYHMWYAGTRDPEHYGLISIGHATSEDGINWERDTLNNPVLTAGSSGNWDDVYLFAPCVIFDGSIYHMWFNGWNGIGNQIRFGHATSPHPDSSWIKDPNNPVLSYEAGSWDYPRIDRASVFYDGETFHMWYSGGGFFEWQIGYATSKDGSNWTKYSGNPVLRWGSAESWDETTVGWCSVIFDSTDLTYQMWYTGGNAEWDGHIGYATAPSSIIYVPAHYGTIQRAINAAEDGDVILVDEGTYYENINFKGKAIIVASRLWFDGDTSHISKTIIDGSQPANPDSGSVVLFVSGEDTTSVLMGFTITNGTGTKSQLTYEGVKYPFRGGGGIFCYNSGGRFIQNRIINNTISNDTKSFGGGLGAGEYGSNAWIILEKNQIMNNIVNGMTGAYGGGIGLSCNGKIINNAISNNSCTATEYPAVGGGIRGSNTLEYHRIVIIKNNKITHNFIQGKGVPAENNWAALGGGINFYGKFTACILNNELSYNQLKSFNNGKGSGGGIYMYLAASGSVISGNIISDNTNEVTGTKFGGGIGLDQFNGLSITNNIIFRNSASHGAGISLTYNDAQIINNTIVNNTASSNGGGIYTFNSNPVVLNTIVWGNEAQNNPQIYGNARVRYSDVQGGWQGEGNINADPLFADTLFNLSDSSWCVGNGVDSIKINNVWYTCPATDYSGKTRPHNIDDYVDMGAIESPFERVMIDNIATNDINVPLKFALFQNYPNPFNPSTTIEFNIPKSEFVELKVYNILGKEVSTLVSNKLNQGNYTYTFDGKNLASGIYYYQIIAGDPSASSGQVYREVKKMILLK